MASHNTINSCYTLTSITYFYTLMKKGPRIQNIEAVRFLPVQVINKADILLLL